MLFTLTNDELINTKMEKLHREYRGIMFYIANNILKDVFLAEDAVNQAFIQAYKYLDKIDENNCPKTRNFFVITCRNISINIYNQRKNKITDELSEHIISDIKDPSEILINKESIENLINIIDELNPIYSEVILLRYDQGFAVNEIADMKNIKPDTVQKRIERAKKQLLLLLNRENEKNG